MVLTFVNVEIEFAIIIIIRHQMLLVLEMNSNFTKFIHWVNFSHLIRKKAPMHYVQSARRYSDSEIDLLVEEVLFMKFRPANLWLVMIL